MSIFYLEMVSPEAHTQVSVPTQLTIVEVTHDQPEFNRFLYQLIGSAWQWNDKLALPYSDWQSYVNRAQLRTWVAYVDGAIAGYFELEAQAGDIEIKYFGLSSGFIGKGLGGALLSQAILQAWAWGKPSRIWVHTCTEDHPNALNNYQKQGFSLYKTEQ